jgi:hypothetical protein
MTVEKVVENRKKQERMERRFLQAVFTYCGHGTAAGTAGGAVAGSGAQQAQRALQPPEGAGAGRESDPAAATAAAGHGGDAAFRAGRDASSASSGVGWCDRHAGTPLERVEVPLGPVTFTLTGQQLWSTFAQPRCQTQKGAAAGSPVRQHYGFLGLALLYPASALNQQRQATAYPRCPLSFRSRPATAHATLLLLMSEKAASPVC